VGIKLNRNFSLNLSFNHILRVSECAIAGGGASFIVTGDTHLLELREYQQMVMWAAQP
jgi:predicted nucleic acid-binding protein